MISVAGGSRQLRSLVGRVLQGLAAAGIDLRRTWRSILAIPTFVRERRAYRSEATALDPPVVALLPMLADRGESAGNQDTYFLQDLWMARQVRAAQPDTHLDVGSRIDGFVAHVLMFADVQVVDVRPLDLDIPGLSFRISDGRFLNGVDDSSQASVSSLHAIEHFGLGRYGDELDPAGSERALDALQRVVAPGGRLYLSVPVGTPRTEFNAHRVFDPSAILEHLQELRLVRFAGIDDEGTLREDVEPSSMAEEVYGVGMFVFERP